MKKYAKLIAVLTLLALMFVMVGCYGQFALTKKVYQWNGSLGNKWVNTIVMWGLCWIPVYGFAGFADLCVLNVVEFWTGSNPVAMNPGQTDKQLFENNGKQYEVVASKDQLVIRQMDDPNNTVTLNYDPASQSWTTSKNGETYTVAKMNGQNLNLYSPDGQVQTVPMR